MEGGTTDWIGRGTMSGHLEETRAARGGRSGGKRWAMMMGRSEGKIPDREIIFYPS